MLYANVYYYWNHSQHRAWRLNYVSKGIDVFSKNLFMSIRLLEKEIQGSHYFTFFALSNLLTQTCLHFCRIGQLTSSEPAKCIFIIYYYICLPLCAHILYFDAAKFSIKLFLLVYFTVSVVRQQNEYEIVAETRPIKTRLHNQLSLLRC